MPSSGFLLPGICFFLLFTRNNVEVTREIKSCQCNTGNSRELFQQTGWCLAMTSIVSLKPKDPVQGHMCIGLFCPFASPQWLRTTSSSSASLKSFFSWLWWDCVLLVDCHQSGTQLSHCNPHKQSTLSFCPKMMLTLSAVKATFFPLGN